MEHRIIYHDVMPMMADVFSGAYARPTELPIGGDFLPLLERSKALEKITETISKSIQVISPRGGEPTAYAKQVAELRTYQDSDSAIVLAGRTLIAFNADATNFATMDIARTKQYSENLQSAAMELVKNSGVDITDQVEFRPLAKNLMVATGCSYNIAKQHVVKAVRCLRGELTARGWGGSREGAGRPKGDNDDD